MPGPIRMAGLSTALLRDSDPCVTHTGTVGWRAGSREASHEEQTPWRGAGWGGKGKGLGQVCLAHSSPSRSPTHRPGPQQLSPVVDHRHQDLHHSWVGLDKAGVVHTAPPSLSSAPICPTHPAHLHR